MADRLYSASIRPGAAFFLPETEGAEIHANIQPLPGERVIQKNFPNSFRETGLLEHLQKLGVDKLVICGMMTHMAWMRRSGPPLILASPALPEH